MSALGDLLYFRSQLSPLRAARLTARKLSKSLAKRSLATEMARPESDAELLRRLVLAEEPGLRARQLERLWSPLFALPSAGEDARRAAADVAGGTQVLFGQPIEVGFPPRWDWRWDGCAQAAAFHRDVRSTWELQRLQGVHPLAMAGADGDLSMATQYVDAVRDFAAHNPGPRGVAWASALELGLRLVSLTQGLLLVHRTSAFAENGVAMLRVVDRHARWLRADLSLDKVVRGNHLLGELAGLVCAGHLLPAARGAWWDGLDVQRLLEQEILSQFHPDGVSVEQSLTYQQFILEFLVVVGSWSALRGRPFSRAVRERLLRAAGHLEDAVTPDGSLPRIGDCDSGRGAPGPGDPHRPTEVIEAVRAQFGDGSESEGGAATEGRSGSGALRVTHYPEGGHLVLKGDQPSHGPYLFLRGGPFGWTSRGPASHSHEDRLCPVLFHDGEPILVDPGVYGYRVEDRDAGRVAWAHGGLALENPLGPHPDGTFRWRSLPPPGRLTWRAEEVSLEVVGEVPLTGAAEPILWQRILRYNELESIWLIQDRIRGDVAGPVSWAFPFAPGSRFEITDEGGVLTLGSGRRLAVTWEPGGDTGVETGWVSPAYGERAPAPVLRRRFQTAPAETSVRIAPIA